MDKIKRFFECLIPVTVCNLKCEYCYVIQEERRTMKNADFLYSPIQIRKALSKERLGGICYFSICGAGETLVPKETIAIVKELLQEGHYVNITTNGTLTNRFIQFQNEFSDEERSRIHFAFSFHFLELEKKNLIDVFFDNVKRVKNMGSSFLVQLNLYDGYIERLDEIKQLCIENVGALPQIALTRREETGSVRDGKVQIHTKKSIEEYIEIGNSFNSPLFSFTVKNFGVKRKEFCYAGDWSGCINLATGIFTPCYASNRYYNIMDHPEKPIRWCAMGTKCCVDYCVNSSHFLSLGVIPDLDAPTYAELRNRSEAGWYNDRMNMFLNQKLSDNNITYSKLRKIYTNIVNVFPGKDYLKRRFRRMLHKACNIIKRR